MDFGDIPWTAVVQYEDRHRLTDYESSLLRSCVVEFDSIQRKHASKKTV